MRVLFCLLSDFRIYAALCVVLRYSRTLARCSATMTDVLDPVALSSWAKDDSRDEELTPEQELEKLRAEKKALQMRVLGVNELARLLQDRTSELKIMEEKNKRLEVAVVRLENRCSNFEKKLKSQSGVLPKSGQMPLIPGPSRQILDSLMKENAELKKVINKQTSKGPTSYLEAVVSMTGAVVESGGWGGEGEGRGGFFLLCCY